MQRFDWNQIDAPGREAALARPAANAGDLQQGVAEIIARVRQGGDAALRELTQRFDGCTPESLEVTPASLEASSDTVTAELEDAIAEAMQRIEAFHAAGMPGDTRLETAPGLSCEARYLPIRRVGLYIPGGSAPLISTVLMLAVPARLAGCGEVVLCSPPTPEGDIHPAIRYAAGRCGVTRLFRVGGAQAIAAMAYGTESVPKCDKLFGPGNAWVTEAKRQVAADPQGAAQDLPAGPSEVLVIADAGADPHVVCWDMLSQAEHGPDSQAIVVSDSDALLDGVQERLPALVETLPRASVLSQSLRHARLIRVDSLAQAIAVSNRYAPEHLIINCEPATPLAEQVTNAGSVFLGRWTPESLGDYCSGTNHVLPTNGYARAFGGLSVVDFQRRMTLQQATPEALATAGRAAMVLAEAEGLTAHREAVACRLPEPGRG
ncbi:MAG: histidinol dehydrogenase [Xanthomonadales bacterium]|nr:histidinol dehydrogenase [Xanthomonadales bacterium]NIN58797.1 histidinol dehydrogenase [Xanthomonadales bacterium]NIN74065.1 histidinol dehydrogenase [Xanthomonadales bacterium]NIO14598.1 histidinol dehydrogenase [Xanthomonadales bacterium]NIP11190.1 histidinol dehydrogenase [Xanthomonadales bacterium]